MKLSQVERAYFAGILDGEGCLNIHKNSNQASFTARIQVGMSTPLILNQLKASFGGSIRFTKSKTRKHKDSYMWYAVTKAAKRTLLALLPFLKIKQKQARILLALIASTESHLHISKGTKGIHAVPKKVFAYRQALKKKIHQLNRTGKD